jgi:hypothetical protein
MRFMLVRTAPVRRQPSFGVLQQMPAKLLSCYYCFHRNATDGASLLLVAKETAYMWPFRGDRSDGGGPCERGCNWNGGPHRTVGCVPCWVVWFGDTHRRAHSTQAHVCVWDCARARACILVAVGSDRVVVTALGRSRTTRALGGCWWLAHQTFFPALLLSKKENSQIQGARCRRPRVGVAVKTGTGCLLSHQSCAQIWSVNTIRFPQAPLPGIECAGDGRSFECTYSTTGDRAGNSFRVFGSVD